ncbi:MAG: DotA/TraY family protein, partial [Pseudomonadota bacterium]
MNTKFWIFVWMIAVAIVAVIAPELAWASNDEPTVEQICQNGLFCVTKHDISAGWISAAFPNLVQLAGTNSNDVASVVVTKPATSLASALQVLNSAALAVGSLILTYKLFADIVQTANDGEVLGKRWSTLWGPVRVAISASLIVPTASGYCLAQALVVAIALAGVGLANRIWEVTINNLMSSDGMIASQIHPAHERVAKQVFANNVCVHAMNMLWAYNNGIEPSGAVPEGASIQPSWQDWNWTGVGNLYENFPSEERDYGSAQFPDGSLFYRRADWLREEAGLGTFLDPAHAYMGWTLVDVSGLSGLRNFIGATASPNTCGKIDVEIPPISNSQRGLLTSFLDIIRPMITGSEPESPAEEASMAVALNTLHTTVAKSHLGAIEKLAQDLDQITFKVARNEMITHLDVPGTVEEVRPVEAGAAIYEAAANYKANVVQAVNTQIYELFSNEALMNRYIVMAKDGGWAVAGEWFLQLMSINGRVHELLAASPVPRIEADPFSLCDRVRCSDERSTALLTRIARIMDSFYDQAAAEFARAQTSNPGTVLTEAEQEDVSRMRNLWRSVGT